VLITGEKGAYNWDFTVQGVCGDPVGKNMLKVIKITLEQRPFDLLL